MHLFWEPVIEPLLDAANATTVTEIGVDYGVTTRMLLERAEKIDGGLVHAIDPAPSSDAADLLGGTSDGRLDFHRARSHDVLSTIGAVDAVLLDGDHNWFTVIGELRLLAEAASASSQPLPLIVAHDVGWPYGRRDMYYDPASIPAEWRHEAARDGMLPGRSTLDPDGMNPWLWNAAFEGGPRNGVLTAIEDFASDLDQPTELVVLNGFHGLGILASADRIDSSPLLEETLARLRSSEFARGWSDTLERARIDAELAAWRARGKPFPPDEDVQRWGA